MAIIDSQKTEQFMELLTQHQGQLLGYIVALTHDLEDARDVYQQTSLVLWQKFDTFEPGTNFAGWACRVARFEAMNFLRARRHSRATLGDALLDELAETVEAAPPPQVNRQAILANCLNKLPPLERALIDRCYMAGTTVKDVAHQLGRTSQSVCNSLRRIRLKLMECMDLALSQDCT